jgi:hypothetical protein
MHFLISDIFKTWIVKKIDFSEFAYCFVPDLKKSNNLMSISKIFPDIMCINEWTKTKLKNWRKIKILKLEND